MSRQSLSREQLQQRAARRHTWQEAAARAPQIAPLFEPRSPTCRTLDRKLVLGDEALRMLRAPMHLGLGTYVEQLRFTGHHELARYAQQFHPSEMA
ncbi:hypothetical protein [Rhodanobacter spathiphylli]|uniref:Uncharacterized protein n=1 Tax=Rhodanobacter spathiphylli B39 TaxID=1163407 RepID=I4VXP4_9GAMM|nr:hypothetical protein [Rhodanobacter spathiphylli]EIL91985.1 hypothetical protein UU7_11889 [Rhodanobacter spathiphylli B39]